jgi:hypothetical protein
MVHFSTESLYGFLDHGDNVEDLEEEEGYSLNGKIMWRTCKEKTSSIVEIPSASRVEWRA